MHIYIVDVVCVCLVDQSHLCVHTNQQYTALCMGVYIRPIAPPLSPDTSISDRSMELSEIDARLSALQEFMKKSLASRKQPGIS